MQYTNRLVVKNVEKKAFVLHKKLMENFGKWTFCRRWLEDQQDQLGKQPVGHLLKYAKDFEKQSIVDFYQPQRHVKGCPVAAFGHTVLIGSHRTEVVTRGEDN